LQNISLDVGRGEFLCIVGPSGCGKSTLLHVIAGLRQQTSGTIRIDGKVVAGPGPERILIFQDLGLFPWLTVAQNVEFGLKVQGFSKSEQRSKAQAYLRLVRLPEFGESFPHELSGGMRQRVAIARALAASPSVLLMDEPFAALDAQSRDLLHDELERIWAETECTIVFVTHNVREAVRLGDRVVLLRPRPARINCEYAIDLPRPRHIEEPDVARVAREIQASLREETSLPIEDHRQLRVEVR
jgi:NitT/TauT family transport system ATP-binding protein